MFVMSKFVCMGEERGMGMLSGGSPAPASDLGYQISALRRGPQHGRVPMQRRSTTDSTFDIPTTQHVNTIVNEPGCHMPWDGLDTLTLCLPGQPNCT